MMNKHLKKSNNIPFYIEKGCGDKVVWSYYNGK